MATHSGMMSAARLHAAPPGGGEATALPDECLRPVFDLAARWAGEGLRALVLSGSHASGGATWIRLDGRRVTLSDVDLYAVLQDASACRAAEHRARAERPALAARLATWNLYAPLEVSFLTRDAFARLPARPGTLELARHGVVVSGDVGVLGDVPRWHARDVSDEERRLLLENRAFELLAARAGSGAEDELAALRARHAVLKTAADLAGLLVLEAGEWPERATERMVRAREWLAASAEAGPTIALRTALEPLWERARAWRGGDVRVLPAPDARAEWLRAASTWCALWSRLNGSSDAGAAPWGPLVASAARAPLRRKLRLACLPEGRGVQAPLGARLRWALRGTPQHRVNASAAVLLFAAVSSRGEPALPAGALRALRTLGVTRASGFESACADVSCAWDHWVLDGQHTQVRA